ncbi:MAG: glycoside hydrolase family 140 protein [Blautia sp.]|nr:glycoside hydrolase family 140 protein [Blautia sp.]
MDGWNRGRLHISENGRYLMEGEHPFFWLGDTAWLMLQKLDEREMQTYLRNRREKGYNVIQTVLAHTLPGVSESGCSLAPGLKDVTKAEYWEFVDTALDMAARMGLYLGLLPSWGSLVKDGVLNKDNIAEYAEFLGKRFQKYSNIIWILGGDVRGDAGQEVYPLEAKILKRYNPERLIIYHPFGRTSSSLWFHGEEWLDFNMFQSGHRRYDQASLGEWDDNAGKETFFGEDSWRYVERDHGYDVRKPTLDAEPSYEGIPQGLHNPRNPYWEEWDVRRYVYWAVFAGAAGHTYGSNAIMQFYTEAEGKGAYGVREGWQDALHHPGAGQMKYLKELMESVDFVHGGPDDSMLRFGQKERYHRISVFAGEDYVLCYDYSGDEFLLDLTRYRDREMDAWWMDPRNGVYSYIDTLKGQEKRLFRPAARKERANDWVLVLKEKRHGEH